MPRVQVGSMVAPTEEIRAYVWYREPAQRLFGTRFRLHWPKVVIVQADDHWSFSGVPFLDAAEWVFGTRSLPTRIRVGEWHGNRLEFVPPGAHFRMMSSPSEGLSEVIGLGTVSGHKPFGVHAYPADFRLEDVAFARLDAKRLDRKRLRFRFDRTGLEFDGHWSEDLFTPPDGGRSKPHLYRHLDSLEPWTGPARPASSWVCLYGPSRGSGGPNHPGPFTDGDVVQILDREGHLATGRVARGFQGEAKPVLAGPYPSWVYDLDPF